MKKCSSFSVRVMEANFFDEIRSTVPKYFVRLYLMTNMIVDGNDADGGLYLLKHSRTNNHQKIVIISYYSMYTQIKPEKQEVKLTSFFRSCIRWIFLCTRCTFRFLSPLRICRMAYIRIPDT